MKEKDKNIFQILFLVLVILICSFFVYRVHHDYSGFIQNPHENPELVYVDNFSYPFPIHVDEWTHLSQIIYILESNTLGFMNPYPPAIQIHQDLEAGYHLILAAFFKISSLDPISTYQYFATIFFIINSLLLFFLTKKLTHNYWIGLLSVIFFLAIPSNSNILGNWFAVPLTFSIFIIFAFFIFFIDYINTKEKKYFLFATIFYLLSFCYPLATILITLITFSYLVFEYKIYEKLNKNKIFLIIGFLGVLVFALLFQNLIFNRDWTSFQFNYSLIFFYGILPTLFSILGAYFVLAKKINKIFLIWPLICLINLVIYKIFEFGLFLPYERTFFYYLLGLVPLAAIGLFYFSEFFYNFLIKRLIKNKKIFVMVLVLLLLVSVNFFFIFNNYYPSENNGDFAFIQSLDEKDYDAIKFIGQNLGERNIVLADPFISLGIYPIGKNSVVAIENSNLEYGDTKIASKFFSSSCEDKQKIAYQNNVVFVLSRFELKCSFLIEKYNRGDYIYLVG